MKRNLDLNNYLRPDNKKNLITYQIKIPATEELEPDLSKRPSLTIRKKLKECFFKISFSYAEHTTSLKSYEKDIDDYESVIYNSTAFSPPIDYYTQFIKPMFFLSHLTSVKNFALIFKSKFNTGIYILDNLRFLKYSDFFPEVFSGKVDERLIKILEKHIIEYMNYIVMTREILPPIEKYDWSVHVLENEEKPQELSISSTVYIFDGTMIKEKKYTDIIDKIVNKKIKNKTFIENFIFNFPNILSEMK